MAKAGVLHGKNQIHVEDRPVPRVEKNDVLIKVGACSICGTDLRAYNTGDLFPPGTVAGHEFAGDVVDAGKAVEGIKKGDRVCVKPMPEMIGILIDGGFAEYALIKNATLDENILILPDTISDEEGALIEPLAVGIHGVNRLNPKPEDNVVIFGAGPIGLCTVIGLKAAGVNNILVTDFSQMRLDLAMELGAGEVLNIGKKNLGEFMGSRPQPEAIVECAGVLQAMTDAINMVATLGKVLVLATYEEKFEIDLLSIQLKEIDLIGSLAYTTYEFKQAIDIISSGKIDTKKLITHRFSLDDISRAFEVQKNADEAVKVMIKP